MHSLQFDFAGKARQEIRLDPQGTLMLQMYVLRSAIILEQEACKKKADVEAARVKKQKETQIGNYLWDVLRESLSLSLSLSPIKLTLLSVLPTILRV